MIRHLLVSALLLTSNTLLAFEPDQLFEKLSPSIWAVWVYDTAGARTGGGSAVVIGPEELVTNCHVLARGKSISVKRGNTQHDASLLHSDIDRDLCTLRVKDIVAPAAQIAPLASVRVGQRVYAIGVSRGVEQSLSEGLVSSLSRGRDDAIQNIQISIPISPELSGGGLFDQQGRLLGITTWSRQDAQNQYFARPAEWISEVPERSNKALEKLRDDQLAAASAKKPAAATPPEDRQLSNEELRRHFENLVFVSGSGSSIAGVRFEFRGGRLTVRELSTRREFYGSYRFKDSQNQICIMLFAGREVASENSRFKMLQDCYKQFEVGKSNFALRSANDGTAFFYTMN